MRTGRQARGAIRPGFPCCGAGGMALNRMYQKCPRCSISQHGAPIHRARGARRPLLLASMAERATFRVKTGLAEMLKGGVIMDVTDAEQARIAEDSGACAVMALERVPADIRAQGGVARMSNPAIIKEIQEAVTIPVMAKARIGHFAEAQILQSLEVDYVDESEVLTPADEANHIDKLAFDVPFVCGATNLGEALRRVGEGAAMIRSKGEAGTGNIVEAVRHMREITDGLKGSPRFAPRAARERGQEHSAPLDVQEVAGLGRLPVLLFCAGGIATPADAALMMQLGAEGNFVGSGIFKSSDPERRARAIVEEHFADPERVAKASMELGERCPALRSRRSPPTGLLQAAGLSPGSSERPAPGSASSPSRGLRGASRDARRPRRRGARGPHPAQLAGLDGLVIPGGESTTISKGWLATASTRRCAITRWPEADPAPAQG